MLLLLQIVLRLITRSSCAKEPGKNTRPPATTSSTTSKTSHAKTVESLPQESDRNFQPCWDSQSCIHHQTETRRAPSHTRVSPACLVAFLFIAGVSTVSRRRITTASISGPMGGKYIVHINNPTASAASGDFNNAHAEKVEEQQWSSSCDRHCSMSRGTGSNPGL